VNKNLEFYIYIFRKLLKTSYVFVKLRTERTASSSLFAKETKSLSESPSVSSEVVEMSSVEAILLVILEKLKEVTFAPQAR